MPFSFDHIAVGSKWTRQELAKAWGYRAYQAFARGVFTPKGEKVIILFVSREKPSDFTQYQDGLSGDYLRWEGELGHANDQRIVRAGQSGEQVHVFYRQEHRDPFTYLGQAILRDHRLLSNQPSQFTFQLETSK